MAAVINNVVASWSMIQLKMTGGANGGFPVSDQGGENGILVDATSIKWNCSRKIEDIYGLGGQSRGRGFGNVTYTASITLPYQTQADLQQKGGGTLMGLGEFDIIVSWQNDLAQNMSMDTVTLKGCIFSESAMEANQDDTSITHEYDLHPYRIFTATAASNNVSWSMEMYNK